MAHRVEKIAHALQYKNQKDFIFRLVSSEDTWFESYCKITKLDDPEEAVEAEVKLIK